MNLVVVIKYSSIVIVINIIIISTTVIFVVVINIIIIIIIIIIIVVVVVVIVVIIIIFSDCTVVIVCVQARLENKFPMYVLNALDNKDVLYVMLLCLGQVALLLGCGDTGRRSGNIRHVRQQLLSATTESDELRSCRHVRSCRDPACHPGHLLPQVHGHRQGKRHKS
jgi:hypothetical protein